MEENADLPGIVIRARFPSLAGDEDAHSQAALALCRAALHWNPEGQARFPTYASACIRRELARYRAARWRRDWDEGPEGSREGTTGDGIEDRDTLLCLDTIEDKPLRRVLAAVAQGESLAAACRREGMPETTARRKGRAALDGLFGTKGGDTR